MSNLSVGNFLKKVLAFGREVMQRSKIWKNGIFRSEIRKTREITSFFSRWSLFFTVFMNGDFLGVESRGERERRKTVRRNIPLLFGFDLTASEVVTGLISDGVFEPEINSVGQMIGALQSKDRERSTKKKKKRKRRSERERRNKREKVTYNTEISSFAHLISITDS